MKTATDRVLVHVRVKGADLRAALGRSQSPATLVFTSLVITAITPDAAIRIPAATLAQRWPGIHQTGVAPRDADRLRDATATGDTADITLTASTLTLTTADTTVTVGRW